MIQSTNHPTHMLAECASGHRTAYRLLQVSPYELEELEQFFAVYGSENPPAVLDCCHCGERNVKVTLAHVGKY
jgi:hypothetical protein